MFFKTNQKKIAEYQNDLISKHCDEVENIYKQMRGWRHDYHNHIQYIKACIHMGEIDKLVDFCNKLDDDLVAVDTVIKTGNVMIDAILNSKLSLALSKNIDVTAKAVVPTDIQISNVDLCVLLGNLLDNALEACEKVENAPIFEFEKPFIRVYISVKGNQLYLCVTNSAYGTVSKIGNKFFTTKQADTHGFGLMRIDKICEKYSGYCKRNNEVGVFSTEILLPMY